MRFKQSLLGFARSNSTPTDDASDMPSGRASRVMSKMLQDDPANDTIVTGHRSLTQLPTPSESATDTSSQDSLSDAGRQMIKSRSKRVAVVQRTRFAEDKPMSEHVPSQDKSRSISGETLVAQNLSQSSLLQRGVDALDMSWDLSSVCVGKEVDASTRAPDHDDDSAGSIITVREATEADGSDGESDEDEAELAANRAAKEAKMQENAQKWEDRRNAADNSATRRSNRASSIIGRAGTAIADLASGMLGKRTRDQTQPDPLDHDARSGDESASKKARLNEKQAPKLQSSLRREKKWLSHGLYAGQSRTFDPRLTEAKNKKNRPLVMPDDKENTVIPLPMYGGERLLRQGRDFKLPFDVFSPLPTGQPKPDEWRKTNKNVFVGDAAHEWRISKFVEHSTCLCRPETGCDQNCMNRYMYYECDEKNCNLKPDQCGNRAFEGLKQRVKVGGKYNVGVEVIKTADRGYGVRSNRTFDPNQIIVEYTGEIITQEECEDRMHTMYKDNECYYLMLFDQNMIIDATRGSMARFVNHSCEPNCRMEKWTVGGKPRMALFAGDRGIMTGEELTYDYNFDPYSQKNVQVCRCGAIGCRGVLGPKPKEPKQKTPDMEGTTQKPEGRLAGAKRKVAEVLEEGTNRLQKKRKIEPAKVEAKRSKTKFEHVTMKSSPGPSNVKKSANARRVSIPKTTAKMLGRSDSQVKKLLTSAKRTSIISMTGKRVVSQSSATQALIPKETQSPAKKIPGRSLSLKDKAASVKGGVVRSLRGRSRSLHAFGSAV